MTMLTALFGRLLNTATTLKVLVLAPIFENIPDRVNIRIEEERSRIATILDIEEGRIINDGLPVRDFLKLTYFFDLFGAKDDDPF